MGVGAEGGAVGEEGGGVAVGPHAQHHQVQLQVGHHVAEAVRVLPVTCTQRGSGEEAGHTPT